MKDASVYSKQFCRRGFSSFCPEIVLVYVCGGGRIVLKGETMCLAPSVNIFLFLCPSR